MTRRSLALLSLLGALGSVGSVAGCSRESEDCSPFPAEDFPAGTYLPGAEPLIPGATDVSLTMQADRRAVVTFTKDGQRYRAVYALSELYRWNRPPPVPGVITIEALDVNQAACTSVDAIELRREGRLIATAQKAELHRLEDGPLGCIAPWDPEDALGPPDGRAIALFRQCIDLKLARGAVPLRGDILHVYASGGPYRLNGHGFTVEGHGNGIFYLP